MLSLHCSKTLPLCPKGDLLGILQCINSRFGVSPGTVPILCYNAVEGGFQNTAVPCYSQTVSELHTLYPYHQAMPLIPLKERANK